MENQDIQITLNEKYRPRKFEDVVGQTSVVSFLKKIVHTRKFPQVMLMIGQFGTGKTTLARIFTKAINCLDKKNAPCYQCKHCRDDILFTHEFDATQVGNVDFMREFVSQLDYSYVPDGFYEFIIFDESHLISRVAQSALLKVLENSQPKVRFLFCTTETQGMLEPILSRSLSLPFTQVSFADIYSRVKFIANKEQIEVSEEDLHKIVTASRGHVRDAIKFLDFIRFGGTVDIIPVLDKDVFYKLFISIRRSDEVFIEILKEIMKSPLPYIKYGFYDFVEDFIKLFSQGDGAKAGNEFFSIYSKQEIISMVKLSLESWVNAALSNTPATTYSLFYYFYSILSSSKENQPTTVDYRNRFRKV